MGAHDPPQSVEPKGARTSLSPLEGMIVMILALSIRLAATIYGYLNSYAPSNVLIRHLQTSSCRGWAVPISAALAAVCYLALVVGLNAAVESGGPTWLNLIVFTCVWNTIRFAWLTVFSAVSTAKRLSPSWALAESQASGGLTEREVPTREPGARLRVRWHPPGLGQLIGRRSRGLRQPRQRIY